MGRFINKRGNIVGITIERIQPWLMPPNDMKEGELGEVTKTTPEADDKRGSLIRRTRDNGFIWVETGDKVKSLGLLLEVRLLDAGDKYTHTLSAAEAPKSRAADELMGT